MAAELSDDVVRIILPPGTPRPLPWFGPLLDLIPDEVEVAVFQEVEEGSAEGNTEILPVIAAAFATAAATKAGSRFGGWVSDQAGAAWRDHTAGSHKAK